MRFGLCLAPVVLASSCADGPSAPTDCAKAKAQFWDCFDRYQTFMDNAVSIDFEAMWYACIPHSEPKRFAGSWSIDFEWSRFHEGREPTPEEAFEGFALPQLAFKKGVSAPPGSTDKAQLWAISFIGREETCKVVPDTQPTIFVEEVLEQKLVWEVQGYPSYSFEEER